jgi:hypothetical protein
MDDVGKEKRRLRERYKNYKIGKKKGTYGENVKKRS